MAATSGEEPAAVVHLAPGMAASEAALQAWVMARLAVFKTPVAIRFVRETLSMKTNRKVLKRELGHCSRTGGNGSVAERLLPPIADVQSLMHHRSVRVANPSVHAWQSRLIVERSFKIKAYFFRKTHPSEPECVIPSIQEGPLWPSQIGRGEEFDGTDAQVEIIRLERHYAKLGDFLLTGIGNDELTVSDRVRLAVEAVEPDRHQFLPIDLVQSDGTPFPTKYWGWNIRNFVDCYRWGRHTYFPVNDPTLTDPHRQAKRISLEWPRDRSDIVLDASEVAGLHAWRDGRSRAIFLSGEACASFERFRVKGYQAEEVTLAEA